MRNFELSCLCTVLLRQIVRRDGVYRHLATGFESVNSAAEVYLEQPLWNEWIVADVASSKVTQKDRKPFFLGIWEHVKAAAQYLLAKCPVNNDFFRSLSGFSFPKPNYLAMGCRDAPYITR